ncbi:MAG: ferredoxin III, nif-specific [Campylobacterales bacterium]
MAVLKKNGSEWVQEFVEALNKEDCIACGRCYKACPSGVMTLEEDEDEDGEDIMFMVIVNDGECIGCKVCAKVCPKGCFEHSAA